VTTDDELFDQVGVVLGTRGGWRYEPSTSPGGPPSWCLDPAGVVVVSVNVVDGAVVAYLPDLDREVRFADVAGLVAWMDAQEGAGG